MNALTVTELAIDFGERQVLSGLTFTVSVGEFFVIIGPNGSGKTTLLKTIAGLLPAARGAITIFGQPLASFSRRRLAQCLAVVPQQMPEDFPFTVAATVLMGRSPHLGFLKPERQQDLDLARQAMAATDVSHLAGRRLDQLSAGECQRVIIARAICQQPRLILLDEPTAALDPAHQLKIMGLMEQFRRELGITVVMVSHDLNLAAMYASRLLFLKQGRVLATGAPAEVLTAEQLQAGYGCRMMVDAHPCGCGLRVTAMPGEVEG